MEWSTIVSSEAHVSAFLEKVEACNCTFGTDVESTAAVALEDAPLRHDLLQIVGIGFGFPDGSKTYFPFAHAEGPRAPGGAYGAVKRVLEDPKAVIWVHNSKYEHMALRSFGIEIVGTLLCSQIAQYSLGKRLPGKDGLKLKPAARKFLKMRMRDWEDVVPIGTRAHEVPSDTVGDYCGDDSLAALRLGEFWVPKLKEYGAYKAFVEMSCEFAKVLSHMREVGFAIDRDRILEIDLKFREEEMRIVKEFESIVGVHPNRNQAVSARLFKEMQVWPILPHFEKGSNGEYPVNKEVRGELRYHLKKGSKGLHILELKDRHSKVSKFISNYTISLVEKADRSVDGRLRCEFNQTRTETGRLASSKPNLQNIPNLKKLGGEIRDSFVADEGWDICDADYSQADLRMMAHLSCDPNLMRAYNEDLDVHQQTADACGCDRGAGKVVNLGIIYEMMAGTLAHGLGIPVSAAEIIWNRWHGNYPGVRKYQKGMHLFVATHGYVRTITGRLRFIPKGYIKVDERSLIDGQSEMDYRLRIINNPKASRKYSRAFREASNTPDQGSVADVLMLAARNMYREWKSRGLLYDYWTGEGKVKILSFVHDEAICEFRKDFAEEGAADLRRHLENAVKLRVPMKANPGIGYSWKQACLDAKKREEG
jgi:DNA polymerase-1